MEGHNHSRLKRQNLASIKETIYRYGPIARQEIAELLGLTPPTITTTVSALIEQGVVRECKNETPPPEGERLLGRRPVDVDFIPDAYYVIGADLGPYQTSLCLLDLRGNVVLSQSMPPFTGEYNIMLKQLAGQIKTLVGTSGISAEKLLGAGVGLPGFIDRHSGTIRSSFRKDWNGHLFADELSARTNLPVRIENNARARAIGADLFDNWERMETFAYYYISNGIACPMIINSHMLSGESAGAGEVGHMVIDMNGPVCDICGNHGCLDALASERALRHQAAKALREDAETSLHALCKDPAHPTIEEILQAQKEGDALMGALLNNAAVCLGVALANIINLISPNVVIIDGRMLADDAVRERLLVTAREGMFGLNATEVDIRFSTHDILGGAKGAAALAIQRFFLQN